MANKARLELMVKMLREVDAGTWRAAELDVFAEQEDTEDSISASELPGMKNYLDMNTWIATDGSVRHCGYNACAVGHACLDQRFIEQGLKFDATWSVPQFEQKANFMAVMAFFDITEEVAYSFFDPQEPPTGFINAASVANAIEAWINENLL